MFEVDPELPQIGDRVDGLLLPAQLGQQILVLDAVASQDVLKILLLFLNVSDDSFSIVFRYVFCLVLDDCPHMLTRTVFLVVLVLGTVFPCSFVHTFLRFGIGFYLIFLLVQFRSIFRVPLHQITPRGPIRRHQESVVPGTEWLLVVEGG